MFLYSERESLPAPVCQREMYTILSPRKGETVGSSSVYTKVVSAALELFARCDNRKLDRGKNTKGSHIFQ